MRMNSYQLCNSSDNINDGVIQLTAGQNQTNDQIFNSLYNNQLIDNNTEYLIEIKELIVSLYRERYYVKVIGTTKENAALALYNIILTSSNYYGELIRNRAKQIIDNLKQHGSKTTTKTAIDTSSEVIDDQFSDNVLTKESDSGKTAFNADLLSDNYLSRAVRQILDNDERRRQILTSGNADDNYSEVIREIEVDDFIKIETHMKMIIKLWISHIESQILSL